jgi:hypothetical protein
MSREQSDDQTLRNQSNEIQMLTHLEALLNTALEADSPEEKNHAIRDSLQLLLAAEDENQNQQAEVK